MAEEKVKEKSSAGKKRTIDKWKRKIWYDIIAPKEFDEKLLGTTVATKPEQIVGRTIKASVRDLTGQIKKQHVSVKFKVSDVKGNLAHTKVTGHEIREAYLKRLIRRRSSKMQIVVDLKTKDNGAVRVKVIAISGKKARRNQETAVRNKMKDVVIRIGKARDREQLISEFIFGNIESKIFSEIKKICSIKRVEIAKSSIL